MSSSAWILLLVLVLAACVVLVVAARRAASRGADFTDVTISPELAERVRSTALSGRQVLAIKILRDETQMPLAAAKLVVERMVARHHRETTGGSGHPGGNS